MRKSIWTVLFAAAVALLAAGCAKESDVKNLQGQIDNLGDRVTALEKAVKEINENTVPSLQNLVNALEKKLTVTSIIEGSGQYTITFSDGTTATIKDGAKGDKGDTGAQGEQGVQGEKGEQGDAGTQPEVSIALDEDGIYYWTVNGQWLLDGDGNKVPVTAKGDKGDKGDQGEAGENGAQGEKGEDGVTPLFGTNQDHKLIVSYDNGETWVPIGLSVIDGSAFTSAYIDDEKSTDDYIVLVVGETEVQIPKEKAFALKFNYEGDTSAVGANAGDNISIAYEVEGASEGDEITVDVLATTAGLTASVVKVDATTGYVLITVPAADEENPTAVSGKVFAFADNNKGKTNIKVITLEEGVIESVADVDAQVTSAGGEIELTVTTNKEYNVNINDEAAAWLSVVPDTRATHTDKLLIKVEANATGAYRVGVVSVNDRANGDLINAYTVVQQPAADVATDIASLRLLADGTQVAANSAVVVASSKEGALVVDENSAYIYVKFDGNTAVRGDIVSFSGAKKTTEDTKVIYVEATALEVTAQAEEVKDLPFIWFGGAANVNSANTVTTGIVGKDESGNYIVETLAGYGPLNVETVFDDVDIASLEGKAVNVAGYTNGYLDAYDEEGNFTGHTGFIVNSIEALEMVVNPAWSVAFVEDTGTYDKITVTVANGDEWYQRYGWKLFTKAEVEKAGGVANVALSEAARLTDMVQNYIWYYNETVADNAYNETKTLNVRRLAQYGEFVAIAVGMDASGLPTGGYAYCEYEKVDPAVPFAYEDFLGTWIISGSEVVISENEAGVSYNIDNFPSMSQTRCGNHTLQANFNGEKGILEIPDQVIGAYDDPSSNNYGPLKDYFVGWYVDSQNYYAYNFNEDDFGVAAAFYGLPDGTLELRAGANSDGSIAYLGYCTRWIILTGENAGLGNWIGTGRVTLPITGIEKSHAVAASYENFIGDWEMEGVNGVVSIAEKEPGVSYLISGLTGFDGTNYPAVEALFQNGTMVLKEQELADFNHSTYGACKRILQGVFTQGTSSYGFFWFNSSSYQDEPQVIFTAKLYDDGSVNLLSGSCPYGAFTGFRYAWVIVNEGSQYYRNGNASTTIALPSTLTPYVAEADDSPIVTASYADFIGNWQVGDTVLTIEAGEDNTYTISGLPNGDYYAPVTAVFDNGSFYVMEQDLGEWDYDEATKAQDALSGFAGSNAVYPFSGLAKAKIFTAYLKESGNIVTEMGTNGTISYDGVGYSWSIITPSSEYYGQGNQETPLYLKDVIIKPAASPASVSLKNASAKVSVARISDMSVSQRAYVPQPKNWTLAGAEKSDLEVVSEYKK